MRIQPAPAVATWFLKLFCSSAEDDSMIGDLLEKYQDRGRFWYWRQVAAIVPLRLYRNAKHLSLSDLARRMGHVFTLLLVIAAFSAVLLSDIWMILLVAILGGGIAGALIFLGQFGARTTTDPGPLHPGISINHIPVEGAAGLLFVFGTVFVFGAGVLAVREIFVLTAPLAVLFLGILLYWHKHHSVRIEPLDLHKM
jgi:hypothetical protein